MRAKINFKIFLISLAIGLFIVYISSPKFEIVVVYPTPENENKYQYKDNSGTCYKFKSKETQCPTDISKINKIPVQVNKKMIVSNPGINIT